MSEYKPQEIEKKWQKFWKDNHTFKTGTEKDKPKYYVLDMFPYPSGAGLHVGHPLGYIATDIVSRYKRLKGFNVLHPMGFDSFGLPAEQYAVQTGQHPAITTKNNIARYREQLDNIGFSYDWDREVRTSDPNYYKWTQWIFIKLFNHWYNKAEDKAEPIEQLISIFEQNGNLNVRANCHDDTAKFSASDWKNYSETEKYKVLLQYRLAYLSNSMVNWCPQLGTVLANEEVKDGVSERGGYPVIRKEMPQWSLRITAYADRLINDLDTVDWPEPIKDQQRYWIGKSKGCMLSFKIAAEPIHGSNAPFREKIDKTIDVFTTRVDTIYGVTYLTLAPENELVDQITTLDQKEKVEKYINYAKNKSERDRQADVKTVTGEFTGAYAINPLNGALIPIWIGEYVLAGYGTGAVMAVPSSDTRDYAFAKHFNLPIINVQEGAKTDITKEDFDPKAGTMINSEFLNGMNVKQAMEAMVKKVEELGVGYGKINYKIRDAIFSRQRYWGEPIPVYYEDGLPYVLDESQLPLELPAIDEYKPTENGEPPLARAKDWTTVRLPHPNPPRGGGDKSPVFQTADAVIWNQLKENGRENRKNPTEAEALLWESVRKEQLGFTIRRQHAVSSFIADFIQLDKKVIIEIDGGIHETKVQKEFDVFRTEKLKELGYEVIRFTNDEVLKQTGSVIEKIKKHIESKVLPTGEDLGGAFPLETNTMPGWAGSSWYFLRYMDPTNSDEFASKEAIDYWQDVDLYLGGSEHATGHLLYSRFWHKFLFDLGLVKTKEYAKKLINQGMIQGMSQYAYKYGKYSAENDTTQFLATNVIIGNYLREDGIGLSEEPKYIFYSADFLPQEIIEKNMNKYIVEAIIPIQYVENDILDTKQYAEHLLKADEDSYNSVFICEGGLYHKGEFYYKIEPNQPEHLKNKTKGKFKTKPVVEKMSKSKLNVVNPDDVTERYGADTLRLYEMFLGPLEMSKPWNTNSISGVSRFLRNVWKLFYDEKGNFVVTDEAPIKEELKALHKTIKKVEEDIERFSFNTSVSTFMVCVNELTDLKCHKKAILKDLLTVLSPYAPHIVEELWEKVDQNFGEVTPSPSGKVGMGLFPQWKEEYLKESSFEYPVSVNGKLRFKMEFSLDTKPQDVEKEVLASQEMQKWLEGKAPKKVIVVPNKIVNVVV